VLARTSPGRTPARIRIPAYAVWETVVFVMNILAFIFIGLQLRPILAGLGAADRNRYLAVAGAVLLTVIVVRIAWHMSFNTVVRWRQRRRGFHPPRPMMRPTFRSGLVVSWAGMRGILSLAAALALPPAFPYRGLIVLTAFSVVFGTLVIQGLTLKPLLRALKLSDDDPIGRELRTARACALSAALAKLEHDQSPAADAVRQAFTMRLDAADVAEARGPHPAAAEMRRAALQSARQAVLDMRANREIGDDAFHLVEEDLDWLEMAVGGKAEIT
jgi:monovalent cation/hydrogen antiporter